MAPAEIIRAVAGLATQTIKLAQEAKDRASRTPKAVPSEAVEKAASALIDGGWVEEGQRAQAVQLLADPVQALQTLTNLATKAAAGAGRDPRLTGGAVTEKVAAVTGEFDPGAESEADRIFREKMSSYRVHKN